MVKHYTSKPVIFEAVQFDGDNCQEIQDWCGVHVEEYNNGDIGLPSRHGAYRRVGKGDYVLKNTNGDFDIYPQKTFEEMYTVIQIKYEVQ